MCDVGEWCRVQLPVHVPVSVPDSVSGHLLTGRSLHLLHAGRVRLPVSVLATLPYVYPMMIRPRRSFRSLISLARHRTAHDLTCYDDRSRLLGIPLVFPPSPSTTLPKLTVVHIYTTFPGDPSGQCSAFPGRCDLSIMAASRLLAAPMAWKSPVKCRLISSIGTTCAYPPPAAPPFCTKNRF